MQDVTCDSEKICLGASDCLVVLDAHEPKEHLLREIWSVSLVTQSQAEKAPEALAVGGSDCGDEVLATFAVQRRSNEVSPAAVERFHDGNGYTRTPNSEICTKINKL